ncbi:MAG TPA: hypothetical protein DCL48_11610, partial [Alphaproteobacteria bacterium]|nr:hypothetical protein [Alphaproteobacteria bacterium]
AGYFVGAVPKGMAAAAHLGTELVFVLEGDEYPASNEDPRSKFLLYRAHDVLLTSVAHDHVNVFPTQDDYERPFRQLLERLPDEGLLVYCQDEPFAAQMKDAAPCRVVSYSHTNPQADYCAVNLQYGLTSSFDLVHRGNTLGRLQTQMLGLHNIQNLVGAAALMLERKVLTFAQIADGFAAFPGVKRRMDLLTTRSSIPVYEGFGSSADKARAAIEAMLLHFPASKLAVVFEPHTFSWRARAALDWYRTVFRDVSLVAILPPPNHGQTTDDQLTQSEIAAVCRKTYGSKLKVITPGLKEWGAAVITELGPNWTVLALSSGSLGGVLPSFTSALDRRFGQGAA